MMDHGVVSSIPPPLSDVSNSIKSTMCTSHTRSKCYQIMVPQSWNTVIETECKSVKIKAERSSYDSSCRG